MARAPSRQRAANLSPQTDPRSALNGQELLKHAAPVLRRLEEDLLTRARGSAAMTLALQGRYEEEKTAQRTAEPFELWQRAFVEQVAAAWLLGCVFVRTLEDRGLVGRARLAGPGALDSQRSFFELAPSLTERDYLLTVFRELEQFPAARELFDARHNPLWLLGPSAEAAKTLLALFRSPSAEAPAFRFGGSDTRFLGDLYQDLSEAVRKRYALLQTPHFVEAYILDHTLEPAITRFGLEQTTLIDPTCGSPAARPGPRRPLPGPQDPRGLAEAAPDPAARGPARAHPLGQAVAQRAQRGLRRPQARRLLRGLPQGRVRRARPHRRRPPLLAPPSEGPRRQDRCQGRRPKGGRRSRRGPGAQARATQEGGGMTGSASSPGFGTHSADPHPARAAGEPGFGGSRRRGMRWRREAETPTRGATRLKGECVELGLTEDDLRSWRPPAKGRGGKTAAKAAAPSDPDAPPTKGRREKAEA